MGLKTIESLPGREADAMRAQLSVWRSAMRLVQGRLDLALRWAERAIREAEHGADPDALAHALYLHDAASVYLGRETDLSRSRRALEIYEELDDLSGQAIVANNLAGFAYFDGRWSEAVELYERSRRSRLQAGDPVEAVRAGAGIGEILCDQGDLDSARTVLEEALSVWRAADYPFGVGFVVSQLGRVAARAGRFDEAHQRYQEARSIYTGLRARSDLLETDTRIAELLVYQGRTDEADQHLRRAAAAADEIGGDPVQRARIHLLDGYVAAQQGDLGEARRRFEDALRVAGERDVPYEVALALEALCRLDITEARAEAAARFAECREIFDRLGVVSVPVIPLVDRSER
jgi:tetratricopeptide (TPR) repeat protein